MNFRLVSKSVTLNDLERHNCPWAYFALFHGIRRKTIMRPTSVAKVYDHTNMICAIIQRVFGQNNRRQ